MISTRENKTMIGNGNDERWLGHLRWVGWSLVGILLVLPAVAMQFGGEVNWSAGDFIFAGVLLIGTGLLVELVVRRSRDNAYRGGAALALAASLLLAWSNAAVGFVGSGANVANVLYMALIGVAFASAYAVGFKAKGMAKAMSAVAVGQGLITVLAYASGLVRAEETFLILAISGFFIALWSASAMLFRKAAQHEAA
jgi:hypothetical protein